jgi:succinate dehydrogenase/fumarate reductase-like Fe-S protein
MNMNFVLKIWRQKNQMDAGRFEMYEVQNISPDASFLEMLDVLNNQLVLQDKDPVAFDHDCREGICGSCGLMINGRAHGPGRKQATCDVRMRVFDDRQELVVEPWRTKSFPVIKDLVVDRTAMDRIMQAVSKNRRYTRCELNSCDERELRRVDGCSSVYRMRRLYCSVPEFFCDAFCSGEGFTICIITARAS